MLYGLCNVLSFGSIKHMYMEYIDSRIVNAVTLVYSLP